MDDFSDEQLRMMINVKHSEIAKKCSEIHMLLDELSIRSRKRQLEMTVNG